MRGFFLSACSFVCGRTSRKDSATMNLWPAKMLLFTGYMPVLLNQFAAVSMPAAPEYAETTCLLAICCTSCRVPSEPISNLGITVNCQRFHEEHTQWLHAMWWRYITDTECFLARSMTSTLLTTSSNGSSVSGFTTVTNMFKPSSAQHKLSSCIQPEGWQMKMRKSRSTMSLRFHIFSWKHNGVRSTQ